MTISRKTAKVIIALTIISTLITGYGTYYLFNTFSHFANLSPPVGIGPPLMAKLENTLPTETFGEVSVNPLPSDFNTSCEGIYKPGQIINVSASGFSPRSKVIVQLVEGKNHSDSSVFNETANLNGNLTAIIRIPVTFKGFETGAGPDGLLFISVNGHSSNAKVIDTNAVSIAGNSSTCGVVDNLRFKGFFSPVLNPQKVNKVQAGSVIPLRFSLPGVSATISDVTDAGFPISGPTKCNSNIASSTTPTKTISSENHMKSDRYLYLWDTNPKWRGCRIFEIKLIDGSTHTAIFDFISHRDVENNWLLNIFYNLMKKYDNNYSNTVKSKVLINGHK